MYTKTDIDDTISRNRKFKEERNKRINLFKRINAPASVIDYEEMIAKMTLVEYEMHLNQMAKEHEQQKSDYAKNNPIQKSIVDEIYRRAEQLAYDEMAYISSVHFYIKIHPLEFMSLGDYNNDLYETFMNHAQELYREKYIDENGVK
jgi:hypothetical protein